MSFSGVGTALPQSPPSGRGGRSLDKCLVQRHADAVIRKSHAAEGEAVNRCPVSLPRKKEVSSQFRGAPVDKRGHIRVRCGFISWFCLPTADRSCYPKLR